MPTLFRFLTVFGLIAAIFLGTLYTLAVYFEPPQKEVSKSIRNVKPKS